MENVKKFHLLTDNLLANYLISGGCGFIGSSLIKRLYSQGSHFIRVVDNLSTGSREQLASGCRFRESSLSSLNLLDDRNEAPGTVELVVGDVCDEKLALTVSRNIDVIVHLAANTGVGPSVENPRLDCITNVFGTFNYLEAARKTRVSRFVMASSGAPVGQCDPPIHEELAPHPVSPYGASKLAGEGYCSAYYRTFGVETVCLRFGNVYGPGSGDKNSVVARFIRRALQGENWEIYGDGGQTRDFIYVEDLVRAICLSAKVEGIGGEVFQIAANTETTISELADKLLQVLAEAGVTDIEVRNTTPRLGDVRRNFSDTSKAKRMFGWQAETELAEGLRKTVGWFIRQGPDTSG